MIRGTSLVPMRLRFLLEGQATLMLEASGNWGGGGLGAEERRPCSACCGAVPCLGVYLSTRNHPPPSGAGGGQGAARPPTATESGLLESSSLPPPPRKPAVGAHGICATCQERCKNSLNLGMNPGASARLSPDQGLNLGPLHCECGVSATGAPRVSQSPQPSPCPHSVLLLLRSWSHLLCTDPLSAGRVSPLVLTPW